MSKPRRHHASDRISLVSSAPKHATIAADSARSPSAMREEGGGTTAPISSWRKPAAFILLFGVVWLSFYAAYVLLPFLRPGSVVIADAKFDTLVKHPMFGPQDRYRVMMFGYSKVLSALRPRDLDAALGPRFRSYNLGLPGEVRFLPILEAALTAGNIPTHVLLTIPWDGKHEADGLTAVLHDDNKLASTLFPFRTLPRDVALFLVQNRTRLSEAVRDVEAQRSAMLHDRGWYFIKSQSHYPGDRLPDDYALPTDHPSRTAPRVIPERSLVRDRLEQLARQHGFQVIFVPAYVRVGEAAAWPAADNARLITISEHPLVRVLGPDYFNYPPALLADPQHMNPTGAKVYTSDLAKLLKASGAFD
ncbi:hypothetical protein [Bradyrhizobium liaoningense]|uniref:hypothetical protein n=1 Tax=Bradyrhizobium liaoningense TaxID=43992 RepID=UPI001BA4BDC9|nr:hypothetical protein [Bradyrhizobium liaoningense]MBR0858767.1 hypothetical protein [Bradyrhizobium liaoningense]